MARPEYVDDTPFIRSAEERMLASVNNPYMPVSQTKRTYPKHKDGWTIHHNTFAGSPEPSAGNALPEKEKFLGVREANVESAERAVDLSNNNVINKIVNDRERIDRLRELFNQQLGNDTSRLNPYK